MLSVHLHLPDDDLFVLACDIRDMTTELMTILCDEHGKEAHETYIYKTEKPQPLCGLYTYQGLQRIHALHQQGKLLKFSMTHVLEVLQTNYLPVKKDDYSAFTNYNTPDDLSKKK